MIPECQEKVKGFTGNTAKGLLIGDTRMPSFYLLLFFTLFSHWENSFVSKIYG